MNHIPSDPRRPRDPRDPRDPCDQVRLREYLNQADDYVKELLKLRARLSSGCASCNRWQRVHRASLAKASSTRQSPAAAAKEGKESIVS